MAAKPWLMRPSFSRSKADNGGDLIVGPFQLNWYGEGVRLHITWPFHKTVRLWGRVDG